MKNSVSQRILALVLHKLGDAEFNPVSKRALARCLGSNDVQVGRILDGLASMDRGMFVRAMAYLNLDASEYLEFSIALDRESAEAAGYLETIADRALRAIRDSERTDPVYAAPPTKKTVEKIPIHSTRPTRRTVRAKASILLATIAAFGSAHHTRASANPVFSTQAPAPAQFAESVYYGKSRRRYRKARRFPGIFPVPPLLPANVAAA